MEMTSETNSIFKHITEYQIVNKSQYLGIEQKYIQKNFQNEYKRKHINC